MAESPRTIHLKPTSVKEKTSIRDRSEYIKNRTLTIKQHREEYIKQWSHVPITKKFKVTVSNGFSAVGLTEVELMYILDMFEAMKLLKKSKDK